MHYFTIILLVYYKHKISELTRLYHNYFEGGVMSGFSCLEKFTIFTIGFS